jgi:hypothetical protein
MTGAVSEAVQRAVGKDGIVRAVTRDDRGAPPMALDEHIVEIARLLSGELAHAELVEQEEVRRESATEEPQG